MADNFGLKIGVEGEKEFKKALSDINQTFKVLGSEMRLVSSEFDKNDNSVKALAARNEVLNKEIDAQKQKIETLRSALQNAAESFGESDKRTQNWQIQLNNAQAALNGMERELDDNNKALQNAENGFDEAGDEAKDFAKEIDTTAKQTDDAESKLSKLGDTAKKVGKAVGAAVAAIGTAAIAAGKQLWDAANDVAEFGDNIDKTSQKIGISAEAYQEWDYVFSRCGADVDNLRSGMKTLSTVITDAGNGSASAAEKLSAVGLSIEDLNGLSQEEQLDKVITALQGMESGAERTSAATDLLGKSAVDMAAVLNMTADDTKALKQEAQDYGMVMSNEAVAASAAFEDSLTRLQGTMGGLKNRMVGELLPGITQIMDGLSDLAAGNENAGEQIKNGVTSVLDSISSVIPQIVELIGSIATAVLESAPAVIQSLAQGIIDAIPVLLPTISKVILEVVNALVSLLPQIVEAGMEIIVSLIQGIAQAIPQIISSLVTTILGSIPQIIQAGIQLFVSLIQNLPTIIVEIVKAVPQIISGLVSAFGEGVSQLAEVGANLVRGLWDGITGLASWLWDQVSRWISGIWDGICDFFGIHSPSKEMAWVGEMLVKGLSGAIDKNGDEAVKAAEGMAEDIDDVMKDLGGGFGDEMKADLQNAIPANFDADVKASVTPVGVNTSANAFNVTIPLTIDGLTLTKIISQIQWNQNTVTVRNMGVGM